jgi:hypothetical protein
MFYQNLPYVEKITGAASSEKLQYLVFAGLSLGILGFTGILFFPDKLLFQRFLGKINPLIAFLIAIILGFILLSFLLSRKWFAIYEKESLNGLLRSSSLAALLAIIMILVDTKVIFPADTNILFPQSLLFYPAIGFFVEIIFHVLPLTILLITLNSMLKNVNFETIVWVCILVVALIEPFYHAVDMVSSQQFPLWAIIYVGIHIFLISIFQLLIFRKYDFISMYSFRLVYYLFWHIGWGYIRLRLLF